MALREPRQEIVLACWKQCCAERFPDCAGVFPSPWICLVAQGLRLNTVSSEP